MRSVFAKVVAIMVGMAAALMLLVIVFFGFIVSPSLNRSFDGLLDAYARTYSATSPTLADARRTASALHIDIRYEGPRGGWTTRASMPHAADLRARPGNGVPGFLPHRQYEIASAPDGGTYLFGWSLAGHALEAHTALLVSLLIVMIAVILAAHVVIQRLLDPLRALNDGVARLGAGELDVHVPRAGHDEFGRLTDAFNQMVERVRGMIHSRDRLLVDVSHELRSPLTRLKVALELQPDDAQRAGLSSDVAEMEHMVAELLELERLRAGQGIVTAPTDLVPLLHAAAARWRDRAPGARVVAPAPLAADVDAEKIRLVLRNLLENAVKYSLPDSAPVQIRGERRDEGILITITDDGVGIPPADVERIFEPFYRVDPSRSKRTGGYGLGLSICKRVMEAHGGTISAERGMPRGARFVLWLPHSG